MNGERALQYTFNLALIVLLLAGCGGAAASDIAVCDTYQHLVDVWPSNSEEVKAASSADEIWGAITDAGEALVTASEAADTAELREAGQQVGEAAAGFADSNANLVKQGFVPFFAEDLVDGSDLGLLCESIGRPITLP
jgi:CRISPR/Cas system-associated exonuclease Cas4 (RecB family)